MNTESGRQPVLIVEIDQPLCELTWGVGACTAALSAVFPHKCFNTRGTCADPDNYSAGTDLTLRFCRPMQYIPKEWKAIPCVESVTTTPTLLNPGGASRNKSALGARATCTIRMKDLPHSDHRVDPYRAERHTGDAQLSGVGYDPLDRGTFWTKWVRRNQYYINWPIRIREGYLGQNLGDMIVRNYIIEDIAGPGPGGELAIKAQDVFALADADKSQCPVQSQGELETDIDDAADEIPLVMWQAGEYPTSGTVRIGDECITYTGTSTAGDVLTLTGATRGTDGTEADSHDAGDRVQLCYRVNNELCWHVARDLLEDFAGVDTAFIPFADWETEGNTWIPTFTVTTLITEPTGVNQLLSELCQQCMFEIWWNERDQQIKMQALRAPTEEPVSLNDRQHIIADSWRFSSDMDQRASQVWVFYDQADPTKPLDESKNYRRVRIRVDPDLEQSDRYGERRVKSIYSRWLELPSQALQLTVRYLGRFQDGAKFLKIRVDAKDRDTWTGEVVEVTLHSMVDTVGLPERRRWQVISAEEVIPGEVVEYNLQNYQFVGLRFAFYMAHDADDYTTEVTDPDDPPRGAWYSGNDGLMSDDTPGWTYQ